MICGYGCQREARYPPRKGMNKWCCESHYNKCPAQKILKADILKNSKVFKGRTPWNKGKKGLQNAWNKGKRWSEKTKKKMSMSSKLTIDQIKEKYPLFSKVEEMRYIFSKEGEAKIQVHCRNHKCKNSKECDGWFTPTYSQLYERIRALEYWQRDVNSLYCSQKCKDTCPLYRKKESELEKVKIYTESEYKTFRKFVLERDKYICQYCGKPATDVHHERPQKLEPFFALDPDFAWSCCEKCHYKKGHPTRSDCSTKNISLC